MMDEEKNVQLGEKGFEENQEVALDTFDTVSSEDYTKERAAVSSAYEIKSKLSELHFTCILPHAADLVLRQSTSAFNMSALQRGSPFDLA